MNKKQYYQTMARLMGPHADPEEFYEAFPFSFFKDATPGDLINAVHHERRCS